MPTGPRVGLVLGAGGVVGGAWLAGALVALERETGWAPATAARLVGTSAGSLFAVLAAAGVQGRDLVPDAHGPADRWLLAELADDATYRAAWSDWLPQQPASIGLTLSALGAGSPWSALMKVASGMAPRGRRSTEALSRAVQLATGRGRRAPAGCWIVACHYGSGRRVVFGRDRQAPAAQAVAASCAIPGYFNPVSIGGQTFVDGGLHSPVNLDLLQGEGLDLVICLCPIPTPPLTSWSPVERALGGLVRLAVAEVEREAAQLRRGGTPVLVLRPGPPETAAMGLNFMDTTRSLPVARMAVAGVAGQLRALGARQLLSPLRSVA